MQIRHQITLADDTGRWMKFQQLNVFLAMKSLPKLTQYDKRMGITFAYDMVQVNKTLGFHDLSYEKC